MMFSFETETSKGKTEIIKLENGKTEFNLKFEGKKEDFKIFLQSVLKGVDN